MQNISKSVMTIIDQLLLPAIPLKQISLFKFGLATLSLHPFISLNSNARMWGECIRATAESRIYRLMINKALLGCCKKLITLFVSLGIITCLSKVNIDFSTFCGKESSKPFQVLAFGLQTYLGRAILLFFAIIQYPIETGSQNIFIIETIEELGALLEFYPRFVLDRGFAIPSLVQFFVDTHIIFYIRSKSGKIVIISTMQEFTDVEEIDRKVKAREMRGNDVRITLYGRPMRLVISDKDGKDKEPWYIITNDFNSTREEVIENYAHRFEIEETFKDIKHLQGLEQLKVGSKQSATIVLWFIMIGMWIAFLVSVAVISTGKIIVKTPFTIISQTGKLCNKHKILSFFRQFFESLQRVYYRIQKWLLQRPFFQKRL